MVVDLPTKILAFLLAPLMFARLHNHLPLLTMLWHKIFIDYNEKGTIDM